MSAGEPVFLCSARCSGAPLRTQTLKLFHTRTEAMAWILEQQLLDTGVSAPLEAENRTMGILYGVKRDRTLHRTFRAGDWRADIDELNLLRHADGLYEETLRPDWFFTRQLCADGIFLGMCASRDREAVISVSMHMDTSVDMLLAMRWPSLKLECAVEMDRAGAETVFLPGGECRCSRSCLLPDGTLLEDERRLLYMAKAPCLWNQAEEPDRD